MMHTYTKIFFDRAKKNAFELIKQKTVEKKIAIAFSLIKKARMRARSALSHWKNKLEVK